MRFIYAAGGRLRFRPTAHTASTLREVPGEPGLYI